MNSSILLSLLGVVLAGLAVALWRNSILTAELRATQLDRNRLEVSLHHNLRAIRACVGYAFPQAVAVCNALETTLAARCRVDATNLERVLIAQQRTHNARLLDTVGTVVTKGGAR